MEHGNESKTTPAYTDLLRFMDQQAQHFEFVPFKRKQQTATHRSYAAVEEACELCGKGNHTGQLWKVPMRDA